MGFYVGGNDYAREDVDSSHDVPEILVESSERVSIVEINDPCDE